jgi:hypothetical protein
MENYLPAQCPDATGWKSGEFAEKLHRWAVQGIQSGTLPRRLGDFPIALNRFSINAVSFLGRDVESFMPQLTGDDEEVLSCIVPAQLRKGNVITASAWCCHFSFYPQFSHLMSTEILDGYRQLMQTRFGATCLPGSLPPG